MEYRRFIDRNDDTVVLLWRTWDHHICRRHGEMIGCESVIEQVLSAPDVVTADTEAADRECQYAYGRHPDYPSKLVKVVVQYEPFLEHYRQGTLKTAYVIESIPPEEKVLWTKPKSSSS